MNMKIAHRVVGIAILVSLTISAQAQSLNLGWNPWQPFMYKNDTGLLTGVDIEIAQAIFSDAGLSFKASERPYARQFMELKDGHLDFLLAEDYQNENESWGVYSKPYRVGTNVLIVLKGTAAKYPIKSWQDIIKLKMRIGIQRGAASGGGNDFKKLFETDEEFKKLIDEGSTDEQNFQKLLAGRFQGFVVGKYSGAEIIRKLKIDDQVEIHPFPVVSANVHMLMNKKNVSQDVINKIDNSIMRLKKDGTIDRIINKYLTFN